MQRNDPERDEEAWRSIVDNYGDRAEIDDDPAPPEQLTEPAPTPPVTPAPPAPPPRASHDTDAVDEIDRFVPPDPPLPPRPTRDRLAAWIGVFGSPIVLLFLVVTGIGIPSLLAYALVVGFIGGFLYLVLHLPRTPEDPWDDGARL